MESEQELTLLSEIAASRGAIAPVSLRINPDVDAGTHEKISTGRKENKFGVPYSRARDIYRQAASLPGLRIAGIDMHIGSQITDLQPFDNAFALLSELVVELRGDGHRIEHVDLGGGLGIPYREEEAAPPLPVAYADIVKRHMNKIGCRVIFEPGRLIAGNAGILVTEVLYVKEGEDRNFVIVDAAMNDLIRPTLYDAWHRIGPVRESNAVRIRRRRGGAGVRDRRFPRARPRPAATQARRPPRRSIRRAPMGRCRPAPTIRGCSCRKCWWTATKFAIVRPRQTYENLIGQDRLPDWLA